MCGIAGWVDFNHDLTSERVSVQAMINTMVCRGPDDEGIWLAAHAVLGHRRLAVIDIERGVQPMIAVENGLTLAVISYSGEVYNFRQLRADLRKHGHRFRTKSDTEVVLHAYLEWGEDFVHRLNGMYAFALWDLRQEKLLLVRDRMGIKPLYYYPLPGGTLFGSEPRAILANTMANCNVNIDSLQQMLTMFKTPGCSVFKDMYELSPGHLLRVRREGLTKHRYWRLEAREHTDDLEVTVRTVRGQMEDIVSRQLVADVPQCTLLSGGLDSSAITALAAKEDKARSFAVDFAGYTENFQPDPMRGTPDGPFVRELVDYVHAEHIDITLDARQLMDPEIRATVLRAWGSPSSMGNMNTSLYMLFRAIRSRSTVALSGESADEIFGGYRWFHLKEAVLAETFPWLVVIQQEFDSTELFNRDIRERLDIGTYISDAYHSALADVPRLPGETTLEKRMREVCYLNLIYWLPVLLDRKDRMSMAVGLEVRVPFCDHILVEYVFNTPWAMKTFDGREKSLLRAAVKDIVPVSILERRKSPYPSIQDPGYDLALRSEVHKVKEPVLEFFDKNVLDRVLNSPDEHAPSLKDRAMLEMALELNLWLNSNDVGVDI